MESLLNVLFEIEFHKANSDKAAAKKLRTRLIKETRAVINSGGGTIGGLSATDLINNATDLINWIG